MRLVLWLPAVLMAPLCTAAIFVSNGSNVVACHYRSGSALPDKTCTPGTTNPDVTQATITSTICVSGWTATVRPSLAVTEPEKFKSMKQYGVPTSPGHATLYEYDHLIPLEIGGAVNDPKNLWPERHVAAYRGKQVGSTVKDGAENHLNALVCSGKITLAKAQAIMANDWRKTPN